MAGLYHYFVEGECEQAFLKALMHSEEADFGICPGKIEILNVLYQKITPTKARTIRKGTKVVFVFDTDVKKTNLLEDNIETIINSSSLSENDIIFVLSNKTLEDEIVYACDDLSNLNDLLGTKSKEEFKKKLIKHKDIVSKLKSVGFRINRMWSRELAEPFSTYPQGFERLLLKKN